MRQGLAKVAAIGVLAAVPAMALADSTTYEGEALADSQATIELKISNGDERRVKQVVVKKLAYEVGDGCVDSGRTPKATFKGDVRVRGNGEFRVAGAGETSDPLTDGQINVIGDATKNKVTGEMKFTFGKTGCETELFDFKATK